LSPDDQADETTRGSLREIVALATLPAIWFGAEPLRIGESLASALFTTLGAEFVYVSLADGSDRPPTAVAQLDRYETSPALAASVGPAISQWVRSRDPDEVLLLRTPLRPGILRVLARPIGLQAELGVIAAAWDGETSPTEFQRLVLGVAVTQATTAIRNALLMRSLRESEERLRFALASAHAGSWEWDARTDRRSWSEECCRLYGIDDGVREMPRDTWMRLIHPDDRASYREQVQRLVEQQIEDCSVEYRIIHPTLGVRWIQTLGRISYADGKPIRAAGINRDITARKRIEHEREMLLDSERAARADAEQANRAKDEFLAMISHELRTPLSAILGWTELLRRSDGTLEHRDRCLDVIERNTRLQTQLISDLLDIGRVTAGKIHLERASVDLAVVVQSAIDACRSAAEAKQLALDTTIDQAPLTLRGDAGRMQQVVTNLINNAIKFTPQGGSVSVSLACRAGCAEIVVRDTGEGIAPEFLPHVFERFSQAESSKVGRHGGLGLGLSIVEHLVRLHGGEVRAESEGLGRGATFTITLPCGSSAT
jgi:PAS domain S-box-containing protein